MIRMNYADLMDELKENRDYSRHILFYPENSNEPIELVYAKGIDSFRLCIDEKSIPPVGLHLSLFNGTFEWKEVE